MKVVTRMLVAGCSVALAIATTFTPSSAQEPGLRYAALGDSYSAGSGNLPFTPGFMPFCGQSTKNFSHVVAAQIGAELTDVSCGGAQTKDFTTSQYPGLAPQLDAVHADTQLVTFTIGGNDAGTLLFAAGACASASVLTLGTGSPCKQLYGNQFDNRVDSTVYPAVRQAIAAVRAKAPAARVLVVGYPWIMPATQGCYPSLPIASGDIPYLRALQAHLNAVIATAASENGATFVDMAARSNGHDACAAPADRWIEPIFGAQSFTFVHPNEAGENAMAQAVIDTID